MHQKSSLLAITIGTAMLAAISTATPATGKSVFGPVDPNFVTITLAKPNGELVSTFVGYVGEVPETIRSHKNARQFNDIDQMLVATAEFLAGIDQKDLRYVIESDSNVTALVRGIRRKGIQLPDTCVSRFDNVAELVDLHSQGGMSVDDFAALQQIATPAELGNPVTRNQALPKILVTLAYQLENGGLQVTGTRQAQAATRQPTRAAG